MATAEQMAAYTAMLSQYKPAQDKPVTEIAVFKLNEPQSPELLEYFEKEIIANTTPDEGINKQAWGFSLSDPKTHVWMLDYDKIQDHWAFWQTPAFTPVIAAITKLFEAGRPLVRHYDFQPAGLLDEPFQRVVVWNDEAKVGQKAADLVKGKSVAKNAKEAYAVDMDETTWRCAVFGYSSQEDADKDEIVAPEGAESHLVKLKFSSK